MDKIENMYIAALNTVDKDSKEKVFKTVKEEAKKDNLDACYFLAKMYETEEFGHYNRVNAVYWFIKTINNKTQNNEYIDTAKKKVKKLIVSLKKSNKKNDIEWLEKQIDNFNFLYNTIKDDELKELIISFGRELSKNYECTKFAVAKNIDDLKKINSFYNKYKIFFDEKGYKNRYFSRYGDLLCEEAKTIEDEKNILKVYSNIPNNEIREKKCNSINKKIVTRLLKREDQTSNYLAPLPYLEKLEYPLDEQLLKEIKYYFDYLKWKKAYSDALAILNCVLREDFNNMFSSLKEEIQYLVHSENIEKGNKDSKLYVAKSLMNGTGVEKNVVEAMKLYLEIFCDDFDEQVLSILMRYYKSYFDVLEAIKEYNIVDLNKYNIIADYFCKKDKSIYLFLYLNNSPQAIYLSKNLYGEAIKKYYPNDFLEKCIQCDSENKKCNKWYEYYSKCSNDVYDRKYYDYYRKTNKTFFEKTFYLYRNRFAGKDSITIVLVGCGNLYELIELNELAKEYNYVFNLIVLDRFVWQLNKLNTIINDLHLNHIWFKKCDFYEELKNDIYKYADIIYFSRCIIPYDYNFDFEKARPKIDMIIKNDILYVFSEVVSKKIKSNFENNAVTFETNFRKYMFEKYKCNENSYAIDYDAYHNYDLNWDPMLRKIEPIDSENLSYFLFFIEGRK